MPRRLNERPMEKERGRANIKDEKILILLQELVDELRRLNSNLERQQTRLAPTNASTKDEEMDDSEDLDYYE